MPVIAPKYDNEQQLAQGMRSGSRETFTQLFKNYAPALLGYISRLTGDDKASEEALQKSFIEIWNNRDRFDPTSERLFTWMLKITKSITLGFIPTNRYLVNLKTQHLFAHEITEDRSSDKYSKKEMSNLQDHLLELMHFNNYSLEEACTILNIEEDTVRSALRSAISKLKTTR